MNNKLIFLLIVLFPLWGCLSLPEQTALGDRVNMVFAGWIYSEDNTGQASRRGFLGRSELKLVDVAGKLATGLIRVVCVTIGHP